MAKKVYQVGAVTSIALGVALVLGLIFAYDELEVVVDVPKGHLSIKAVKSRN